MYTLFLKRLIDLLISLILLILSFPILVLTYLLLLVNHKGNPFFIQRRPGKNGTIFRIYKFKTMTDERDDYGNLLPDDKRITQIGKIVRSTSIDELPQLFNVLKGEMSLIGPRPLLVSYLPLYNEFQSKRHEIRPGITGLAQVRGRNALSWRHKFKYDVWYVKNVSFILDMKIILWTILKVYKREGISSTESATMPEFTGGS